MRIRTRQASLGALLAVVTLLTGLAGSSWHSLRHGTADLGHSNSRATAIHCDCQDRIAAENVCLFCRPQTNDRPLTENVAVPRRPSPGTLGFFRNETLLPLTETSSIAHARAPPELLPV